MSETLLEDNHRISRLETEVAQLQTDVSYIRSSVDRQTASMEALAMRFTESNRPQWSTYASWAGVLLLLIGAFGSGYISDLSRHTYRIDEIDKRIASHELSGGHTGTLERLASQERALAQLGNVLQREMRLLDGEVDTRVAALDELLQREMRLMIATRDAVTERLDRRLEQLDRWQGEHDRVSAESRGRQEERLNALERQ